MGKNNMTFYQAMQLGAERLKPMIKNEEDKKTKQKYLGAFILKNILCILFCMLVVVFFSSFFGSENSMVGVVTILLVLTFRFTNLDFKIDQSAFTLLGVFMIYAICPYLASNSNHFVGFVINFVSILSIIILNALFNKIVSGFNKAINSPVEFLISILFPALNPLFSVLINFIFECSLIIVLTICLVLSCDELSTITIS